MSDDLYQAACRVANRISRMSWEELRPLLAEAQAKPILPPDMAADLEERVAARRQGGSAMKAGDLITEKTAEDGALPWVGCVLDVEATGSRRVIYGRLGGPPRFGMFLHIWAVDVSADDRGALWPPPPAPGSVVAVLGRRPPRRLAPGGHMTPTRVNGWPLVEDDLPAPPEGWTWEPWGDGGWWSRQPDAEVKAYQVQAGCFVRLSLAAPEETSVTIGPITPDAVASAIRRAATWLGGEFEPWAAP